MFENCCSGCMAQKNEPCESGCIWVRDKPSSEHIRLRNSIVFGGKDTEKKIAELEHRIEYGKRQFTIFQTYALLVQAEIMSGAYKLRDTAQGRAVTPEEKAEGKCIGWRKHTDEEKLKNSLDTMRRHIQNMSDANDHIDENRRELERLRGSQPAK